MHALRRHKPPPMRTRMFYCQREEARIAMKAETWPGKEQHPYRTHKMKTQDRGNMGANGARHNLDSKQRLHQRLTLVTSLRAHALGARASMGIAARMHMIAH